MKHLQITLQMLGDNHLFTKLRISVFAPNQVEYLGHMISGQGVVTDPGKVECTINLPKPQELKGLKGFFGTDGILYEIYSQLWNHCKPYPGHLVREEEYVGNDAYQ